MISSLKKFKEFVGNKVWKLFWVAVFVGFFAFAVESSFVLVLQGFLFSVGLLNKAQIFLPAWYPTSLNASVSILITYGIGRAIAYWLRVHFAGITQLTFNCEQRSSLLQYGLNNVANISSKKLMTIFTEITTQSGMVIYYATLLVNTIVTAFLFFVLGLRLAPVEMLIGVFLLFLFLFPMKSFSKKINHFGNEILSEWEKVNGFLLNGLKNYFFLKVHNQIDQEVKNGQQSLTKYQNHYINYSYISSFLTSFPLLMGVIIISFLTYISMTFIKTDGVKLISFLYLFVRLAQTASEGNATASAIKLNLPGFKSLYEWKMKAEHYKKIEKLPIQTIEEGDITVKLEHVFFSYPEKENLLSGINLKISKGDVLVIKGESGSGKSTLLSLILDVNKPTSGHVSINDFRTEKNDLKLDKIIGYIGPEPYLIEATLRENLLYGIPSSIKVSDQEIGDVLKKVELDQVVKNLPNGLNEKLNDLAQFSTGQKQRISFARALLRKPKLFILDEATANLDPETEMKIINNLKDDLKNFTTVIVTHKDSFDQIATQKVKLEK